MTATSYTIKLEQFVGPFDLLLFFIERDELDIYDIPINKLTNDFLSHIKRLETLNIDVASEFILVAATLMKIKARMLIPKKEVDYIFDLDDEDFAGLHLFSKKIAKAIKKAFPCERIGTAVIGLEVPHAHIHLVPINAMKDIDFTQAKLSLSSEEMQEICTKIRSHLK